MRKSEAHPSNWLAKEDLFEGPVQATIASVKREEVSSGDHGTETKTTMHFREKDIKPMILNVTNWDRVEAAYGLESDDWIGKVVELYHDPEVMFGREKKGGIRVRIPNGKPVGTALVGKPLSWEDALSMATEVGMSEAVLKDTLKAEGLKGYSPTKDGDVVRKIIEEVNNIIPF